jgi:hypothetical protein
VATHHQPPVHQQIDGFADGHARHAELLGQFFSPGSGLPMAKSAEFSRSRRRSAMDL